MSLLTATPSYTFSLVCHSVLTHLMQHFCSSFPYAYSQLLCYIPRPHPWYTWELIEMYSNDNTYTLTFSASSSLPPKPPSHIVIFSQHIISTCYISHFSLFSSRTITVILHDFNLSIFLPPVFNSQYFFLLYLRAYCDSDLMDNTSLIHTSLLELCAFFPLFLSNFQFFSYSGCSALLISLINTLLLII